MALVGQPKSVLIQFSHDWTGLTKEEMNGSRYHDDKWGPAVFPRRSSVIRMNFFTTYQMEL